MTPHEQELILEVAQRLRGTRLADKDAEAERLIHAEIGTQPDALYLLTQAVIVQEQGLRHAQERIRQLESAPPPAGGSPPSRGSFLGSLIGAESPTASTTPPAGSGASLGPPPTGASSAVGGFLRSAAAAAAGTVGGQLIFNSMHHWFGGDVGVPWGGPRGASSSPSQAGGRHESVARRESTAIPEEEAGDEDWRPEERSSGGDFGSPDAEERPDADAAGGDFGGTDTEDQGEESGGDF
jgi:hypothetical protein